MSWLQLLGHPAERPEAGGQRPRQPFEELFASMRWGTPLSRDPEVTRMLEDEGLIQPAAPLQGRADELTALAQRFGYTPAALATLVRDFRAGRRDFFAPPPRPIKPPTRSIASNFTNRYCCP